MLTDCLPLNTTLFRSEQHLWLVFSRTTSMNGNDEVMSCVARLVRSEHTTAEDLSQVIFYKRARYMRAGGAGLCRAYRHNAVEVGEGLSAFVRSEERDSARDADGIVNIPRADGECERRFYMAMAIVSSVLDGEPFAIVKEMRLSGGAHTCSSSPIQALLLNACVRRVAVVHKCDGGCAQVTRRGPFIHKESPLDGGQLHVIGRDCSFPPYLG